MSVCGSVALAVSWMSSAALSLPGVIVIGIDGWLSPRQRATRQERVAGGWPLAVIFNYRGPGQS